MDSVLADVPGCRLLPPVRESKKNDVNDAVNEIADTVAPEHNNDWIPVQICKECQNSNVDMPRPASWKSKLVEKKYLDSPLVEVTPFVWRDCLYLLENWQKQWELPGEPEWDRFKDDIIRIRDVESQKIVTAPLTGYAFGSAFVWDSTVYVFAGDYGEGKPWRHITEIVMTKSDDMVNWSEPQVVLRAENHEFIFNMAVCCDGKRFVMLYETNDRQWPPFTFKYCESNDLVDWQRIPNAVFGREKYVGGPALYHKDAWYYTLYLHDLSKGWETRIARSRNLVDWEEAPTDRPFVTYNTSRHPVLRPDPIREKNASDVELCYWKGKTIVYFTGSDQQYAGDLQTAAFSGTPGELLESYFEEPCVVVPSTRQHRHQTKHQLGAFCHFGTATYAGPNGMLTPIDASIFNPVDLDCDQWAEAAKALGASIIVLTAKHHSGFCLWPTETTEYCVRNCPWENGKGDVVRKFVDACRSHDLEIGFYYSFGDFSIPCHSTPDPIGKRKLVGDVDSHFKLVQKQITELLTAYGDISYLWFDGAYDPFGWDVLDFDNKPIGMKYGNGITDMIRKLQPQAVIGGGMGSDGRWSGSEQGWAAYPLWNIIAPGDGPKVWQNPDTQGWVYVEANIFTRCNWFWMPDSDDTLKSQEEMMDVYYQSIGRGANLLVNMTPNRRGIIPNAEKEMLATFGAEITRWFKTPIARTNSNSGWGESATLDLLLQKAHVVNHVILEEDIQFGQRVRAYRLEARVGESWHTIADGLSIGRKRIERFDEIRTDLLRLRILDTDPLPRIRSFSTYYCSCI